MKKQIISNLSRGVVVTAFATIGMVGVAHAASSTIYGEAQISAAGLANSVGTGGKSPEFDSSQYDKVNLGPLSSSLWAPKRGSQGPMRDEETDKLIKQMQDIDTRLGPVGGRNTP
jgi:hypothetical protein